MRSDREGERETEGLYFHKTPFGKINSFVEWVGGMNSIHQEHTIFGRYKNENNVHAIIH